MDIIGQRFERLIVLSAKSDGKYIHCYTRCDCGNEQLVHKHHLTSGATVSCGCFYKESRKHTKTKPRSDRKPNAEASFNKVFLFYKRNARERGYNFNLTKEEFKLLTIGNCYYCDIEPKQESKSTQRKFVQIYKYNGIDRLNNTIGYVLDNCVSCCNICNRAKGNLSLDEFQNWINRIKNATNKE